MVGLFRWGEGPHPSDISTSHTMDLPPVTAAKSLFWSCGCPVPTTVEADRVDTPRNPAFCEHRRDRRPARIPSGGPIDPASERRVCPQARYFRGQVRPGRIATVVQGHAYCRLW